MATRLPGNGFEQEVTVLASPRAAATRTIPLTPTQEPTVNAASADDTGVLAVPTAASTIDPDLRQDLTHAAWMMAVVTLPGLAVLALIV